MYFIYPEPSFKLIQVQSQILACFRTLQCGWFEVWRTLLLPAVTVAASAEGVVPMVILPMVILPGIIPGVRCGHGIVRVVSRAPRWRLRVRRLCTKLV